MKIVKLYYEYIPPFGEYNEAITVATVGERGVIEIKEHRPMGEGDKWCYDIVYENGKVIRTFRPDSVEYQKN